MRDRAQQRWAGKFFKNLDPMNILRPKAAAVTEYYCYVVDRSLEILNKRLIIIISSNN